MGKYILALDQGTTSCRAILVNKAGSIVSMAQEEFKQIFPKAGWVEHNANEIWDTQLRMARQALKIAGAKAGDIATIGITNQRETAVVWDRRTGKPIYHAIVWQDKRTLDFCEELKNNGHSEKVRNKTGLVIDAYFSATKVNWILNNVVDAKALAEEGHLAFGTIDSWLVWNLSGGQLHLTDVTNASRSLLFNINSLEWDPELLELFGVNNSMLPTVRASSEVYGETEEGLFGSNIPISGIAGDQHSALFGQMCTKPGMVKNTYGTGCFMLMNIGEKPIISKNNLLTTIAWQIDGKTIYALEGSIFIGGAVVQWLRDGLKIIENSSDVEALANEVESAEGVYFIPAFAGLGAPHWNQKAQGTFFGITRGTGQAHIARASLESIAYQTMDVVKAMEADAQVSIEQLRVDGGATVNDTLMQFQSDVLQTTTIRPSNIETTVMGAAYLAGLAVGFWKDIDEISEIWKAGKQFNPNDSKSKVIEDGINGWKRAIKALEYWADNK